MELYFWNLLTQLNLTPFQFFEKAYFEVNGEEGDVVSDYCAWVQHKILPKYCIQYLRHLEEH